MNLGSEVYVARCDEGERRRAFALSCVVESNMTHERDAANGVIEDARILESYLKGEEKR